MINGLDSKKSCGHDDIPVRTLKLSKYLLAPLLPNVINESICDSVLLDNLKIAKVVPVFKSRAKFLLITDRYQIQHTFQKYVKKYCT